MIQDVLDTNVLVRFVVGDVPEQQQEAEAWFRECQIGKRKIQVPSLVVAETIFVLESFYKKSRNDIADVLDVFVSQHWLTIPDRSVLRGALVEYRFGRHFVDSYLLSLAMRTNSGLMTFDKDLKKAL